MASDRSGLGVIPFIRLAGWLVHCCVIPVTWAGLLACLAGAFCHWHHAAKWPSTCWWCVSFNCHILLCHIIWYERWSLLFKANQRVVLNWTLFYGSKYCLSLYIYIRVNIRLFFITCMDSAFRTDELVISLSGWCHTRLLLQAFAMQFVAAIFDLTATVLCDVNLMIWHLLVPILDIWP